MGNSTAAIEWCMVSGEWELKNGEPNQEPRTKNKERRIAEHHSESDGDRGDTEEL